jgi:hypothetical protein
VEIDVDVVRKILAEELPGALERALKDPEMQAVIVTSVVAVVRPEFQREHAENRSRFKTVEVEARKAAEESLKAAVAAGKAEITSKSILSRMEDHHSVVVETQRSLGILTAELAQERGERLGVNKERLRGIAVIRWLFGSGVAAGIARVIQHFRHK